MNNKTLLLVAFLFHLPGLSFFYKIKFKNYPKRQNIFIFIFTIFGCLLSFYFFNTLSSIIYTYTLGHIFWGYYLVWYLINKN
jgi:hypothetical protein